MRQTGAALTYTAYKKMNSEGVVWPSTIWVPQTVSYEDLLKTNHIGCLTAMYDARQLGKMYMPEDARREDLSLWLQIAKLVHHHEDYALWLEILKGIGSIPNKEQSNDKVVGINQVLAFHRVHNKSASYDKWRAASYQWTVYRKVEKLSFFKSLYCFCHYAYYGWKKNRIH